MAKSPVRTPPLNVNQDDDEKRPRRRLSLTEVLVGSTRALLLRSR